MDAEGLRRRHDRDLDALGGTGNFDHPIHVFGFTVNAVGAQPGLVTVSTNGFAHDPPCDSFDNYDIGGAVPGPVFSGVQPRIFHTQNVSGSAGDPSIKYTLIGGRTVTFDDLLPAMGIAAGLGSVDIVPDFGEPWFPMSTVRVFNDAGAAGTAGLAEEQVSAAAALPKGATANRRIRRTCASTSAYGRWSRARRSTSSSATAPARR